MSEIAARRGLTAARGSGPVLLLLTSLAVSSCNVGSSSSTEPTPAGFCNVYLTQVGDYITKFDTRSDTAGTEQDPLAAIFSVTTMTAEALGDAVSIFEKADAAAPADIEPDVAAIRDSLKSGIAGMGEAATGSAAAIISVLISSASAQGSIDRLGTYVQANCGGQLAELQARLSTN